MIEYLIEREREENFRTSVRALTFPDGQTRRIETFRIVWTWYDRALAYKYAPSEEALLRMTLRCAEMENLTVEKALGRVLNYIIWHDEKNGMDYTDDDVDRNVTMLLARRGIQNFHRRKAERKTQK